MSVALHPPPLQPLCVAQALDSAVRVFRACLWPCLPYGVLAVIAAHLPNLYNVLGGPTARSLTAKPAGWWALYLVSAVLTATLLNATLLRVQAVASRRRAGLRRELRGAIARMPTVLLLILLLSLATALLALPALLLPLAVRPWGLLMMSGLAAIYLGVTLSCAWVGIVLHGQSLPRSVTASVRLVRGNWWRVAAVYLVGGVMLVVFATIGGVLVGLVVPLVGRNDLALISSASEDVVIALAALAVPFWTALSFTLTEQLRGTEADRSPAADG